jgi:hypothetical protein
MKEVWPYNRALPADKIARLPSNDTIVQAVPLSALKVPRSRRLGGEDGRVVFSDT